MQVAKFCRAFEFRWLKRKEAGLECISTMQRNEVNPEKMKVKGKDSRLFQFHIFLVLMTIQAHISGGSDAIYAGKSLSGNDTIISRGGVFEMGFFSPASDSHKYHLGVWYKCLPVPEKTVVWVANREQPVSDPTSASFELGERDTLVLHSRSGEVFWILHLNFGKPLPNGTVGVLCDDGNFIIRESSNSSSILWQSFDHPTDTLLPGAYGYNLIALKSWKNPNDPAAGTWAAYIYADDGFAGITVDQDRTHESSNKYMLLSNHYILFTYLKYYNVSFSVRPRCQHGLFRYVLDVNGQLKLFGWWNGLQHWKLILLISQNNYSLCHCGEFTICNPNDTTPCNCIKGFVPTGQNEWDLGDHACTRITNLYCSNHTKDEFYVITNARYPPRPQLSQVNDTDLCRLACLEDCSCAAYAYDYDQCFIWKESFSYIQELSSEADIGGDFYVRIAASEIEGGGNKLRHAWWLLLYIVGIRVVLILIIVWIVKFQLSTTG